MLFCKKCNVSIIYKNDIIGEVAFSFHVVRKLLCFKHKWYCKCFKTVYLSYVGIFDIFFSQLVVLSKQQLISINLNGKVLRYSSYIDHIDLILLGYNFKQGCIVVDRIFICLSVNIFDFHINYIIHINSYLKQSFISVINFASLGYTWS